MQDSLSSPVTHEVTVASLCFCEPLLAVDCANQAQLSETSQQARGSLAPGRRDMIFTAFGLFVAFGAVES